MGLEEKIAKVWSDSSCWIPFQADQLVYIHTYCIQRTLKEEPKTKTTPGSLKFRLWESLDYRLLCFFRHTRGATLVMAD